MNLDSERKWFDCYVQEYVEWLRGQNYGAESIRAYSSRLRFFFERNSALSIEASIDSPARANGLIKEHVAFMSNELKHRRNTLRCFVSAARSFYQLHGLEVEKLEFDSEKAMVVQSALSDAELESVINVLSGPKREKERALIYLVVFGGVRLSEILKLNVDDVNVQDRNASLTVRSPEPGVISLAPSVASEIVLWMVLHRPFLMRDQNQEQALFVSDRGNRLTARGVDFLVRYIGQRARLELCIRRLLNTHSRLARSTSQFALLDFTPTQPTVATVQPHIERSFHA